MDVNGDDSVDKLLISSTICTIFPSTNNHEEYSEKIKKSSFQANANKFICK